MFALEVLFKDGSAPAAMIFVRRPQALIGSSNFANVVLEDMRGLDFQLRLVRNLGRSFSVFVVPSQLRTGSEGQLDGAAAEKQIPTGLEGTFEAQKQFDLGPVKIEITALDSDLILREGEAPDRAGVRVLKLATTAASARFPALATTSPAMVISFNPETPIVIGRARPCPLRIESADVSAKHARVGFDGSNFWVEDLGSTNGTFVRGVRVSGKTKFSPGESIMIARDCEVFGLASEDQLNKLLGADVKTEEKQNIFVPAAQPRYPALVSLSEIAKPRRLALTCGFSVKLGREPSSDMWLGAPHISRHHCSVFLSDDGVVKISDQSTNGTDYDSGRLQQGQSLQSDGSPRVLNFGAGVTVALCFSESQEKQFNKARGAVAAFGIQPSASADIKQSNDPNLIKMSDVSKLLGRRGRQATAHHMRALYGSGGKSVQLLIWATLIILFLVLAVVFGLFGAILF